MSSMTHSVAIPPTESIAARRRIAHEPHQKAELVAFFPVITTSKKIRCSCQWSRFAGQEMSAMTP